MKLTEALWEQRNLGVTCLELTAEPRDDTAEVLAALRDRTEQYLVVKLPPGRTDLLLSLQKEGFRFIETLFETEINMKNGVPAPEKCRPLLPRVSYHYAGDEEAAEIIGYVRSGEIFSTDRIALDPAFSTALAGQRYAFWTEDVMRSGTGHMIISEYDGQRIGFNLVSDKGSFFDGLLGGLLPDYLGSGLGFANAYASYSGSYALGCRKMRSHVSSNNFQMMQLHLLFGMQIRGLQYCLVRHRET